jgi:TolB-like protein/DNA-binding winged helix-turn-helix (wHTH) protein/tetratricopeptide (TPR) repeat protein
MTAGLQDNEPFVLGCWEIHPNLNRMVKGQEKRKIRPQVMDLLTYLVRRQGEVVSNDEMFEELWAGKVVSSASIYQSVAKLRRVLADTPGIRLETIPRRGYRLIAPSPRPLPGAEAAPPQGAATPAEPQRIRAEGTPGRKRVVVAAGTVLLVGIAWGAVRMWTAFYPEPQDPAATTVSAAVPVVAVLPFRNFSTNDEEAFFAKGVHEDVLTQLGRLNGIKVISRTSVERFTDGETGIPEIAERLRATHVVEGSVRRGGNRVRVSAQLIDAQSDQHVWAENYDRQLEDVLDIQSHVALDIASALDRALLPEEKNKLVRTYKPDPKAYDLYLEALTFRRSIGNPDRRVEALRLLRRAIEIDPQYTSAWEMIVRFEVWWPHSRNDPSGAHLAAAKHALNQVMQLAPNSVDTTITSAWYNYQGLQEYDLALEQVRLARESEPRRAELFSLEAYILRRMGRFHEAVERLELAYAFDPLNFDAARQLAAEHRWIENYQRSYEILLAALRNTDSPNRTLAFQVDLARSLANPQFPEIEAIMESQIEWLANLDGSLPLGEYELLDRSASLGGPLIYLRATGRAREAETLEARLLALYPSLSQRICASCVAYHAARWHDFRGEYEQAREQAALALTFLERDGVGPGETVFVAWLADYLDQHDRSAKAMQELETDASSENDIYRRNRFALYFLAEALTGVDPEAAQEIYLEHGSSVIPIHDLVGRIHLWYPLLDSAEVRERLSEYPDWIRLCRDMWPEGRPFPFDDSVG